MEAAIGSMLRRWRKRLPAPNGQTAVAAVAGVSQSTLAAWEGGGAIVHPQHGGAVAAALKLDAEEVEQLREAILAQWSWPVLS